MSGLASLTQHLMALVCFSLASTSLLSPLPHRCRVSRANPPGVINITLGDTTGHTDRLVFVARSRALVAVVK